MREERKDWLRQGGLIGILAVSLFIFAPRSVGAFSLPASDNENSGRITSAKPIGEAQFQAPTLAPECRPLYEINGKLYRLNENQTLVPLPQENKVKPEVKSAYEIKIITPPHQTKTHSPLAQDKKAEQTPKAGLNLFLEKKEDKDLPGSIEKGEDNKESSSGVRSDKNSVELKAITIKETQSDGNKGGNLEVLNIGNKSAGKPAAAQNQIKLEGLPENAQEEDKIQITPKIKVQGIYQGSSVSVNAEQKTGNFFFKTIPIERR